MSFVALSASRSGSNLGARIALSCLISLAFFGWWHFFIFHDLNLFFFFKSTGRLFSAMFLNLHYPSWLLCLLDKSSLIFKHLLAFWQKKSFQGQS